MESRAVGSAVKQFESKGFKLSWQDVNAFEKTFSKENEVEVFAGHKIINGMNVSFLVMVPEYWESGPVPWVKTKVLQW